VFLNQALVRGTTVLHGYGLGEAAAATYEYKAPLHVARRVVVALCTLMEAGQGSWGQLTTGQADLALFPLTLTAERAKYIKYTSAFMEDNYGLLGTPQHNTPR